MAAFDYTARDYETIRRDLLARASRVLPDWTDRDPSDFGMLMVDLWAYMGDVLHYYVDRGAGESFLPTATQRESVLSFANLLDYSPQGRTYAEGTVTMQNSSVSDYLIEKYDEFIAKVGNDTYTVFATDNTTVPAGDTAVVPVGEGQPVIEETLTSASFGTSGQRYPLDRDEVVPTSVEVFVYEDGIEAVQYQRVADLSVVPNGVRAFSVYVNADRELEVVFGSTLTGYSPPSGSKIVANYVVSSGAEGNLPINSVSVLKFGSPADVFVNTSSTLSGGVDEESISAMKLSIPSSVSAQDRAVTRNDFLALANRISGVSKAAMSFTQGTGTTDNTVTIYPQVNRSADFLTTGDTSQTVTAELQSTVIDTLQPKALLGTNVIVAPTINWQPIDIVTEIFVNSKYVANYVQRDVEAAIDELFSFDNVLFGQRIPIGQIYRLLLNVQGVDYATITTFDVAAGGTKQESILIDPLELPKKGTIGLTITGGISVS